MVKQLVHQSEDCWYACTASRIESGRVMAHHESGMIEHSMKEEKGVIS